MKTKNLTQNALLIAIFFMSSVATSAQISKSVITLKNETSLISSNIQNLDKDTIALDFIPVKGSYESIRGRVNNVDWSKFRIACFIYVPYYGWINKPYFSNPSVPIDSLTGKWELEYCTGGYDYKATILGLFLISKEYSVPLIGGANAIPQEVFEKSIANRLISRDTIPNTMLTLLEDSVCLGDYITLQANGGSHYYWPATKDTASIITFKADYPGDKTIKVEVSDGKGNGVIKSINLYVIGIEFDDSFQSVLPGDSVELSIKQSVIDNFNNLIWTPGGQTTPSIKVSPTDFSVYTLSGTSKKGGCQLTATAYVNLLDDVSISYSPDTAIHIGTSVTLTANGNYWDKYLWNNGETTQSIVVMPDQKTTYTVNISNDFYQYSRKLSLSINVLPLVSVSVNPVNVPRIYPNPTSDFIFIESSENYLVTGSIKSIQGVEVAHFTFSENTKINTSNLKSGFYVVELITDNRKFQTKLIISK